METKEVLKLSSQELLSFCNEEVRLKLGAFIREFNRRECWVRIEKNGSFEDYVAKAYKHKPEFGYGFVVESRPVPYFHPNRSFHDEVIWLNNNLYYKDSVSFADKLVNSAIVKFYGPSRTLDIITGSAPDLQYLTATGLRYINFDLLESDPDYQYTLMRNIELASAKKNQLWGTTELRTSLQTASRNYARSNPSPIDKFGVQCPITGKTLVESNSGSTERKMRPSDMIHWIKHLSFSDANRVGWIDYYKSKPTMQESFEFLTKERGIGNYYGYHFSSNLARMPGVGSEELIVAEWGKEFTKLQSSDTMLNHGNLNENADYVVAGPGANATLKRLWPEFPINEKTSMKMILAIRDNQKKFFGIEGDAQAEVDLKSSTELGIFTTFGCEISCCQFDVFSRAIENKAIASNRANAPISKEVGGDGSVCLLEFM